MAGRLYMSATVVHVLCDPLYRQTLRTAPRAAIVAFAVEHAGFGGRFTGRRARAACWLRGRQ
jgi:hypothetical protein